MWVVLPGKTTVETLVAHAAGLCLVDLDSVTTPLVEAFAAALGDVADLDAPRFVALRDARFSCLAAVASDDLRAGRDVIAPFTAESTDASAWRAHGARWGADRVVLCWLDVDPASRLAGPPLAAAARPGQARVPQGRRWRGGSGSWAGGIPPSRPRRGRRRRRRGADASESLCSDPRDAASGHNAGMSEDAVDRAQRTLEEGIARDFSTAMSYGDYLDLGTLLSAQHPRSGAPCTTRGTLFIVQHQVADTWLKGCSSTRRTRRGGSSPRTVRPGIKRLARVKRAEAGSSSSGTCWRP